MKQILQNSLKSLLSWIMFAFGIFAVVYASNLALSEIGNKAEWEKLTLSMWNSLVSHVDEKLDKTSVSTTPTLWTSDTLVASQNAVKTYVDTQVGATWSGENYVVYWSTCLAANSSCTPTCLTWETSIWNVFEVWRYDYYSNTYISRAQQCLRKIIY